MQHRDHARRKAGSEIEAFVRRQRRAEVVTRVVCGIVGLFLAIGAVAAFLLIGRIGGRAWFGALVGGAILAAPAFVLLRRALSGVDLDRQDLQGIADSNVRVRRFF